MIFKNQLSFKSFGFSIASTFRSPPLSTNEKGDVVGFSRSMAGVSQATAWFGAGSAISLGALGDGAQFSEAFASNGAQMVVGRSNTGVRTPGGTSVFNAFLWQSGSMTLLSTTGFTFSQAIDVNASGWIVGNATNVLGAPAAALLWNGGASTLLATLVNDASDWTFSSAEGINDAGQIWIRQEERCDPRLFADASAGAGLDGAHCCWPVGADRRHAALAPARQVIWFGRLSIIRPSLPNRVR